MPYNLHKAIENIKKDILSLGLMVEDRFKKAIYAITSEDLELAEKIIESDYEIDEKEVEVEEECLKIMALYQPVAMDLRLLVVAIKINNDLERIADYAVNIAKRYKISHENPDKFRYDYTAMGEKTGSMLEKSLEALVRMDLDMACEVINMDKQVNIMRNEAYDIMKQDISKNPDLVEEIINMYLVSRHLERIGDHTKNIAEEVIHLVKGKIIRHS